MTSRDLIEAQKAREARWVREGVEKFMRSIDDPERSPLSGEIMKRCVKRLTEALEAARWPLRDPLAVVVPTLGAEHVAAMTVSSGVHAVVGAIDTDNPFLADAERLGEAVEFDLRFAEWSPEAEPELVRRVARLFPDATGMPARVLRHRQRQAVREMATEVWPRDLRVRVGADLFGLLATACPDVFVLTTSRAGSRTLRFLRLTGEAYESLMNVMTLKAVTRPQRGLMIVPPNDWRYAE